MMSDSVTPKSGSQNRSQKTKTHTTTGSNDVLIEQQRKDALLEQERMRKWIEEDEPLPVKMSCKLRQHIVAKENQ